MKTALFLMKMYNAGQYHSSLVYWYGILERLGYQVFYEDYDQYDPDEFHALIKENKPDFIFHPTYQAIHTEFLALREFSKVYLLHSDDDWRFNNYGKFWIPFVDGAIGLQQTKQTYINEGAPPNYYIRTTLGFNPNTMLLDTQSSHKKSDVIHMGGLHGGRDQSINHLQNMGVPITVHDHGMVYSDYLKHLSQSKIALCFTNNSVMSAKQNKGRTLEILNYCVLASDEWPDMEIMDLEPNKDFILLDYSNTKYLEMFEKVLNDDKFREQMFKSGRHKLLTKNTIFHRWDKVMSEIDEDYTGTNVDEILKAYQL